jgi:excisionase family DNA binding protein
MTLITMAEACKTLRLSRYTLWRFVRDGRLAAYKLGGRIRYDAEALNTFISNNQIPTKASNENDE